MERTGKVNEQVAVNEEVRKQYSALVREAEGLAFAVPPSDADETIGAKLDWIVARLTVIRQSGANDEIKRIALVEVLQDSVFRMQNDAESMYEYVATIE